MRLSPFVAVLITLATPVLHCQPTAVAAKPIQFEIVSIHPTVPGHIRGDFFTEDGYSVQAVAPYTLLTYMGSALSGVPDWCYSERYDIVAKVAEADISVWKTLTFKQKSLSIQPMLEDRFHLKWHTETKMEPGYELVIAKGGPKLKVATPDETYPNGPKEKDGTPKHTIILGRTGFTGQAVGMDRILYNIQLFARAPVADKTGLSGIYNFTLVAEPQPPPAPADSDLPVSSGPSLFLAVQQQLGLKLVPARVPVVQVVIDHIERPSGN